MGTSPDPIAASRETQTYAVVREQIYRHPQLWRRNELSQHKKLAAITAVAGLVSWLWVGASTHLAPEASYPYYDTQKPVPPWSEPMPLKGNLDR